MGRESRVAERVWVHTVQSGHDRSTHIIPHLAFINFLLFLMGSFLISGTEMLDLLKLNLKLNWFLLGPLSCFPLALYLFVSIILV